MRRDEYVEYVINEYGSLLKGVLIRNLCDKADRCGIDISRETGELVDSVNQI